MDMDVIYTHCAGLDVHKKTVVACRIVANAKGKPQHETRSFNTTLDALLALSAWLREAHVTHVAMESTGVYWKPIFNVLASDFDVWVVNAHHIKQVPGRKTDVKDAQWIAQLLRHGLLKPSFIPDPPQRAVRDLVRYRKHLIEDRTREINRVQNVLEDANLKLTSVAADVMGTSAREMLEAISQGADDPQALAQLARGRMRQKIDDLERALTGRIAEHHRFLLRLHLEHIDTLNEQIAKLDVEIDRLIRPFDVDHLIARLDAIPGIDRTIAEIILSEIGTDMSRFASAAHLASWAGLAPGKNESAGRERNPRTLKANRYLRPALVQAAHAARRTQTYLGAQYRRLARRRGAKRAAIAVAHSILVIVYHMIARGTEYHERGADYFDTLNTDSTRKWHQRRLEQLGYKVTLEPLEQLTA